MVFIFKSSNQRKWHLTTKKFLRIIVSLGLFSCYRSLTLSEMTEIKTKFLNLKKISTFKFSFKKKDRLVSKFIKNKHFTVVRYFRILKFLSSFFTSTLNQVNFYPFLEIANEACS